MIRQLLITSCLLPLVLLACIQTNFRVPAVGGVCPGGFTVITMPNGGQGCADSAQVAACLANAFQGIQCLDIGTDCVSNAKLGFCAGISSDNVFRRRCAITCKLC